MYPSAFAPYTAPPLSAPLTLDGSWRQLRLSVTLQAAATAKIQLLVRTTGVQAVSFWVDGIQVEQKGLVSPYVHTDGAAATRSAARCLID